MAFLEQVLAVHCRFLQILPVVATRFALPGFIAAQPRDIGPAARAYPGVRFLVYHSGYDTATRSGSTRRRQGHLERHIDALIKSLRENNWDATKFVKKASSSATCPTSGPSLGSVWRPVMHDPDQAAHLLGKLITFVGPKRIAWGTDSLWYGSPQAEIVAMRRFEFSDKAKEFYGLPHGLDGDIEDLTRKARKPSRTIRNGILGRNAARAYNLDPDKRFSHDITCDQVNELKTKAYMTDAGHRARERTAGLHGPGSTYAARGRGLPGQLAVVAVELPSPPSAATLGLLAGPAGSSRAGGLRDGGDARRRGRSHGHDYSNSRFQKNEKSISRRRPAALPRLSFSTVAGEGDAKSEGDITGTANVADGCVYVATNRSWVFALNADTGKEVWRTKLPRGAWPTARSALASGAATRRPACG